MLIRPEIPALIIKRYLSEVRATDILPVDDRKAVLFGLFGEVGSIMSAAKKLVREQRAYPGYRRVAEEEFGDALWYLAALCRRCDLNLASIFESPVETLGDAGGIDRALFSLGVAVSELLQCDLLGKEQYLVKIQRFVACYMVAVDAAGLNFQDVVWSNIRKVRGAFLAPDVAALPTFDEKFGEDEKLPWHFEIRIDQRGCERSYLRWNGVFIGDPLTDNMRDADHYRFHDVFHFAHAAVLHWSPVFRSLIKQKRKSDSLYDEVEDGGRAIVVEEGLTAWIFSRAKELDYFDEHSRVSFEILKTIQEFTKGYEVERCPLRLWERAILMGYSVFRCVRDSGGGWVIGDRASRSLSFKPL